MRQFLVDPPSGSGFVAARFATYEQAEAYAKLCPSPTRIVDRSHGPAAINPPNPKQRYGDDKVSLALFPTSAVIYGALACMDGAEKYGPYNWRDKAVEAMTYVHACERHVRAWLDGEENASDSGKPHLGHALACLAILVDAIEQGNLIDNRPLAGSAPRLLDKWAKAKRLDDELLTETFGPKEDYAPAHVTDGGPCPCEPIVEDYRSPPVNGAEVLGLNKIACRCRPTQACMVEAGIAPKYVFCKRAEDADKVADPYGRQGGPGRRADDCQDERRVPLWRQPIEDGA